MGNSFLLDFKKFHLKTFFLGTHSLVIGCERISTIYIDYIIYIFYKNHERDPDNMCSYISFNNSYLECWDFIVLVTALKILYTVIQFLISKLLQLCIQHNSIQIYTSKLNYKISIGIFKIWIFLSYLQITFLFKKYSIKINNISQ